MAVISSVELTKQIRNLSKGEKTLVRYARNYAAELERKGMKIDETSLLTALKSGAPAKLKYRDEIRKYVEGMATTTVKGREFNLRQFKQAQENIRNYNLAIQQYNKRHNVQNAALGIPPIKPVLDLTAGNPSRMKNRVEKWASGSNYRTGMGYNGKQLYDWTENAKKALFGYDRAVTLPDGSIQIDSVRGLKDDLMLAFHPTKVDAIINFWVKKLDDPKYQRIFMAVGVDFTIKMLYRMSQTGDALSPLSVLASRGGFAQEWKEYRDKNGF